MDFPPFENSFFGGEDDPSQDLSGRGQFDHLVWMTHLRGDASAPETRVITLHEMWHHELNNVSTYGCILSVYAQLARHAKSNRDEYGQVFRDLAERARTAHEVYATWHSTELLSAEMPREALIPSPEYQQYFDEGNALVESLDRPYLRQQAFLCALRMCFESGAVAEHARSLEVFNLSKIRDREFPTARLRRLKSILPSGFFQSELDAFLEQAAPRVAEIVRNACAAPARAPRSGPAADEEDAASSELHHWFHSALAKLFSDHGMPSNAFHHHLQFIEESCPLLDALCDTEAPTYHRLVPNRSPLDNAANLLIQAENEVLFFRESPLPASLCHLADIPVDRHPALTVGVPAHWFLCIRLPAQILAQHELTEEQAEWVRGMTEPIVFLRRRGMVSEGGKCELVLFRTPEELTFIRRLSAVPALACISSLCLANGDWCDRWLPVIGDEFLCVILFDLSLSRTLRDGWPEFQTIHYAKGTLSDGSVRSSFLTFLGIRPDKTCAVYVVPCTEMFEGAVVSFIRHRLDESRFVQNDQFLRELQDAVPVVVQHLLAEEFFFSLNQLRYGYRRR
jgi:hypothetical protein